MGSGVVSSTGVAGCISITSTLPVAGPRHHARQPADHRVRQRHDQHQRGHSATVWGASSPDIFANSCDLSSYQPTRPFARDAARRRARRAGRLRHHRPGVADPRHPRRAEGRHPRPARDGHQLLGPQPRRAAQRPLDACRRTRRTARRTCCSSTRRPGPGPCRRSAATTSIPTKIDQAKFQAPPTLAAGVRSTGAARTLQMAYAVPPRRISAPDRARQGRQPDARPLGPRPAVAQASGRSGPAVTRRCSASPSGSSRRPGRLGCERSKRSSRRAVCRSCRRTSRPSAPRR